MKGEPLRIGIVGAGRVFERLYGPALALNPGIQVAGIADPRPGAGVGAGVSAPVFPSLLELLDRRPVQALVVLTPPRGREQVLAPALERGLPCLAEKPLTLTLAGMEAVEQAGGRTLVTPVFSRRFHPAYRHIRAHHDRATRVDLRIRVSPAGWGSYEEGPPTLDDLGPHTIDMSRWLTGAPIVDLTASGRPDDLVVSLRLGGRATARLRLGHGPYREAVRVDGATYHVGPPSALAAALGRARAKPAPDVASVAGMLAAWHDRLAGLPAPGLADWDDAVEVARAIDAARSALSPLSP